MKVFICRYVNSYLVTDLEKKRLFARHRLHPFTFHYPVNRATHEYHYVAARVTVILGACLEHNLHFLLFIMLHSPDRFLLLD